MMMLMMKIIMVIFIISHVHVTYKKSIHSLKTVTMRREEKKIGTVNKQLYFL